MIYIRYFIIFFLFITHVWAEPKKVYFYTTESNISDFKSLKVSFDKYLKYFGKYEFQAFSKKETFEKYLKKDDVILILSSWHYQQIIEKHSLKAKLVALKKQSITDTKVLVGRIGSTYTGTVTSAYSRQYSKKLIDNFTKTDTLELLIVPKEIDALMSVGFGMNEFALVSRDSFELMKKVNTHLSEQLIVFNESSPTYRMLVASKLRDEHDKKLIDIFTTMNLKDEGKKILDILGIDDIVVLTRSDLEKLGGKK